EIFPPFLLFPGIRRRIRRGIKIIRRWGGEKSIRITACSISINLHNHAANLGINPSLFPLGFPARAHIQVYSQRLPTEIMDHAGGDDNEGVAVVGFEVPTSPDSSYNNPIPGNEDEAREPPLAPPHLNQTLLSFPPSQDDSSSLPLPQNVILNHLYIEKESSRSVVALGITHRYRSKFVTVVLYKPVQRRGT
ncbi:SNF1-related protein kinase regulatory subunit beta-3, partial [Ananas comosus]